MSSSEPLLAKAKPLSVSKIIAIVVLAVMIFLGSVIMLVYGSTWPTTTSQQKIEQATLLTIGSIVLVLSIIVPIVYCMNRTPMSEVQPGAYMPAQAAANAYRGV